ncbi:MAG TPA: hypothetical protein VFB72_15515 [Verrucomicrobiae bacterium]|nr:hypothetical protein [Verrucomicrobiae bacterium]
MDDFKMQDTILRTLYNNPGREAVLVPSMFNPPIMLSNIFRIGGMTKAKGLTTPPTRRMGGWHLRLLEPGIAYCEAEGQSQKK